MSDDEQIRYAVNPTDVVVCLRTGVWNITGEPESRPGRTQRAIIRGLLEAALETVNEWESPIHDLTTNHQGRA